MKTKTEMECTQKICSTFDISQNTLPMPTEANDGGDGDDMMIFIFKLISYH
jgi:hypothetical protein